MSEPGELQPIRPTKGPDTGKLLGGRYLLGDVRGRGGFATVYRADDRKLGAAVAVKLLDAAPDAGISRRFKLEIKIGARICHPRLIRIVDDGEHEGRPFAVMPLLRGTPLDALRGSDWRRVCRLMSQYLEGMRALHEARAFVLDEHRTRLLHRDIKPANCFVSADGDLTILDLGLVKALDEVSETADGQILGSPAYMAPECLFGETASERSDVYSLGVTFFEMLTGERPYRGDLHALHAVHAERRPPPQVRASRPEVPMALDRLVQEAMAGLPAERPPTVAAMLRRLHTILRRAGADEPGRSITITPLRPPGRQTRVIEAPAPEPAAPVGPAMPPRPRLWPMYGLAASVMLVLVLVVSRDERARRRGDEAVAELAARVARDGTKAAVASRCDPDDAGTTWRRAEAEAGVTAAASGSAAKNRTWMSAPGATAAGATAAGATTPGSTTGDAPSPRPDLASARQRSLRRTLQSARGDVLACFDELGGNRGKRIDVRVKIEADGRASEVTIGGAARTSLVRCITAALRAQTYANGPAAVMVRHSFTFATESERP